MLAESNVVAAYTHACNQTGDLVSNKRSKLWGECRSPVDSSMCAVSISSSSTEVGEIVPPCDYKSEYLRKQCMLCSTNDTSSPWSLCINI